MQRACPPFRPWQAIMLWLAFPLLPAQAAQVPGPPPSGDEAPAAPAGGGEYADSFTPLSAAARQYERDPQNRYTYCIRNIATYECLSYDSEGAVRRQRTIAVLHGTGFAYKEQDGATYLLTNQHVAAWPQVTDAAHPVDDVPSGCKLISQALKIVDNDDDDYEADDVPLTLVAADPSLDAAIVKARARLRLLPYRIGRSAALEVGDVVMVRGFPLGAFQAVNTGMVTNPYDRDHYKDWDHSDFIIDAPLSSGNSGSPVLAVSRRTGEYELVGVFHASYTHGNQLNAAIGIEQLRDFMTTMRPPSLSPGTAADRPGPAVRAELAQALSRPDFVPFLALGPLTVGIHGYEGGLLFEVYSRRFPLDDHRLLMIADQPVQGAAGKLARVWLGNERGLKEVAPASLDAATLAELQAFLDRFYALAGSTLRYRALLSRQQVSRQALDERAALRRTMGREALHDAELTSTVVDMADRLSPRPADQAVLYQDVLAALHPPPGGASLARGNAGRLSF